MLIFFELFLICIKIHFLNVAANGKGRVEKPHTFRNSTNKLQIHVYGCFEAA